MGKSTVAEMIRAAGVPVFDADAEVRAMQGPGGEALPEIESAFPGATGPEGVDRAALGAAVFGNAQALARLEAIVLPRVVARRAEFLRAHVEAPLVVFDIPLLFEKQRESEVDAVVVVSASAETQRQRVLARPGMAVDKFEHILSIQLPDAEKRARADYVIYTDCPLSQTQSAVAQLVSDLKMRTQARD